MNVYEVLTYVVLGMVLGAVGQSIRAIVGVKKASDEVSLSDSTETFQDRFDLKRLIFSLIIGSAAGSLSAISLLGISIDRTFLLTVIAAGYAGADFIEGFMKTKIPK